MMGEAEVRWLIGIRQDCLLGFGQLAGQREYVSDGVMYGSWMLAIWVFFSLQLSSFLLLSSAEN